MLADEAGMRVAHAHLEQRCADLTAALADERAAHRVTLTRAERAEAALAAMTAGRTPALAIGA